MNRVAVRSVASRRRAFSVAMAGLLSACASYQPRALIPEDELAALRAVSLEGLRIQHARPGVEAAPTDLAFDPSDGLDEPELVAVALTLSPKLRAQRLEIGEAQALLVAAGLWPNPTLDFSFRWPLAGTPFTGLGLGLLFELLRPDERPAKRAVAEQQIEVARAEIVASELELVSMVRQARLKVLAGQAIARMLQQEVDLRAQALVLVRQQRDLGETTEIAVALAELEQSGLARELRDARAAIDADRRALNALAGLPPEYDLRLSDADRPLTFTLYDDIGDDELDRRLVIGRFDLRARRAAYDQGEQELRLAIARQGPRTSVGPAYEKDVEGNQSLGVGASIELPLFDRNQGEIAEKTAARERLRAEYAASLQESRARAFGARAALRRAREEVELGQREIAPLLARTETLFEAALKARELSIFEWITAQSRGVQVRRDLLDGLVRYANAVAELESATGMPLAAETSDGTVKDGRP